MFAPSPQKQISFYSAPIGGFRVVCIAAQEDLPAHQSHLSLKLTLGLSEINFKSKFHFKFSIYLWYEFISYYIMNLEKLILACSVPKFLKNIYFCETSLHPSAVRVSELNQNFESVTLVKKYFDYPRESNFWWIGECWRVLNQLNYLFPIIKCGLTLCVLEKRKSIQNVVWETGVGGFGLALPNQ